MRPEHVIRQMWARLLALNPGSSIWRRPSPVAWPLAYGLLRRRAGEIRGGDLSHQLAPAHAPGISHNVDARHTSALDDVVADSRGLDARHLADVIAQFAGDAQLVVA